MFLILVYRHFTQSIAPPPQFLEPLPRLVLLTAIPLACRFDWMRLPVEEIAIFMPPIFHLNKNDSRRLNS
jgi:hypothetical protein